MATEELTADTSEQCADREDDNGGPDEANGDELVDSCGGPGAGNLSCQDCLHSYCPQKKNEHLRDEKHGGNCFTLIQTRRTFRTAGEIAGCRRPREWRRSRIETRSSGGEL